MEAGVDNAESLIMWSFDMNTRILYVPRGRVMQTRWLLKMLGVKDAYVRAFEYVNSEKAKHG